MLRHKHNEIEWLTYELLADCKHIDHRVFLRHGGSSQAPYDSLNFGTNVGDDPKHVSANYEKAREVMQCSSIVVADQRHGKSIMRMSQGNRSHTFGCDGLTTNARNLPLLIQHADCQAACFYDPIKQALTMVHCGWRGNIQNIYAEAVAEMRSQYGSNPADLLVCISPSLGPEKAEFVNYKEELPESFWQFQSQPFHFDLWALGEWQLTNAGVLPEHIQIARECTSSNPQDYFSYRRSNVTGRHGSLAILMH